jgi:hypothetical protein
MNANQAEPAAGIGGNSEARDTVDAVRFWLLKFAWIGVHSRFPTGVGEERGAR